MTCTYILHSLAYQSRWFIRRWAESGFGPHQGRINKGTSKETKQRASYARWPLAASAVNKTDHSPINPLNAELNPICYLLALLGNHHILHDSRIRVKPGTDEDKIMYNIVGPRKFVLASSPLFVTVFSLALIG